MKQIVPILVLFALALAGFATAADIDGKWVSEIKMPAGKKGGGEGRTVKMVMNLQSEGALLKGAVTVSGPRRDNTTEIQNGKIEGNKFSFNTVAKTRQGENKLVWSGTVNGDQMEGARTREGGRRSIPFTARRQ